MLTSSSDVVRPRTPVRRIATAAGLAALLLAGQATPALASPGRAGTGGTGTAGAGRGGARTGEAGTAPVDVVVRTGSAATAVAARAAVRGAGGTVGRDLGLICGFAARLPASAVGALRRTPGVVTVTVDASVQLKSDTWLNQPGQTLLAPVIRAAGADKADRDDPDDGEDSDDEDDDSDAKRPANARLTGEGIGVALIDSGVAPVKGLTGKGKIINGPDLSFESQSANLRYLDTFGHGTHLAGIIAGQDPPTAAGVARFDGVAPGAHIVSLKVAAADGASDISQVIAAIDWAVEHRNDTGLNIRVLNLSFGTDSTQAAALDPLSFAVEQAWKAGIVVVVAVGNDGFTANQVTMPAANPAVIAVGAADPKGTEARADDVVADFSNRGNAVRHADILAAGRSVVSLRSPGSYIDVTYPTARLSFAADAEQRFLRGSGTSQSAAVVSGAVALLLQQRPQLQPNQVKQLLMGSADPIVGGDAYAAGAGQLDLAEAAATETPGHPPKQNLSATGLGSLEASRGTAHVYDSVTGVVLAGEKDIFGKAWTPQTWAKASAKQQSWSGGTFNGSTWAGGGWGANQLTARTWSAGTWSARTWSGSTWTARTWSSATWTGAAWSARTWSARTWSARTWSSADWPGEPWQ